MTSIVQSCIDSHTPNSSSGKAGQNHSAGCRILQENKSEVELTGHSADVVNSISSLPTAKPKASSRSKPDFCQSLPCLLRGKNGHLEGEIASSQSDAVFTSEPSVQFRPHVSSSVSFSFSDPQLYFFPFSSSHFLFNQ